MTRLVDRQISYKYTVVNGVLYLVQCVCADVSEFDDYNDPTLKNENEKTKTTTTTTRRKRCRLRLDGC